jgi:DNA-binding protein
MQDSRLENVVLIGKKPTMNYVVACLTLFNSGKAPVVVRARGMAISRAIDTVQLLGKAFVKNLEIKDINIGTQEFMKEDDVLSSSSTIEITINKPSPNVILSESGNDSGD